jgi:murein L,D-transpeptidase YcbB/YkuD
MTLRPVLLATLAALATLASAPRPAAAQAAQTQPQAQAQAQPASSPVMEALRERIEAINATGQVAVQGELLRATRTLSQLYPMNGFQPLWDGPRLRELLKLIEETTADGLTPADYHLAGMQALMARGDGLAPLERASLDLLASDAFSLILYHLYFGKVDPLSLDSNWNFETREITEQDALPFLYEAITAGRIRQSVDVVRPSHWMYQAGREALAIYRGIAARGGWQRIPEGTTLKVGMSDPRVPLLRQRLAVEGDLTAAGLAATPAPGADPNLYDAGLESAVKRAQRRYRLGADGVVGAGTLRALNVPVQQRVDQLRVNLERGRWVLHEVKDGDLVIVDIAGFLVRFVRDRKTVWESRTVVGQPYRQTPVFKATIDHVVLNPTWTVPPGILEKDIMPSLRRNDRSVLARKRLKVLDRSGRPLNPAGIDFSQYTARNFPFMLRQDAGPDNALGVVKIMFPNPHLVYLHDTPSKSLFDEDLRVFSSGCIRTERPLELAELLLGDPAKWNRGALDAAVAVGETRTVRLPKKVPVLIIYWTADRDDDGTVVFKPDPYERDARELAALNQPFRFGRRAKL